MTLIRVDEIKTAMISSLKGKSAVTSELDDTDEIREFNWDGQNFTYPNIRVRINDNLPSPGSDLCLANTDIDIFVFSEEASSTQANRIAGIIADEYHKKSLNSEGLFFTRFTVNIIPAIKSDKLTWRSQVNLLSTVGQA